MQEFTINTTEALELAYVTDPAYLTVRHVTSTHEFVDSSVMNS